MSSAETRLLEPQSWTLNVLMDRAFKTVPFIELNSTPHSDRNAEFANKTLIQNTLTMKKLRHCLDFCCSENSK